jgi:SAM-dependent methyltransferase
VGVFLEIAGAAGWEAVGIEPSGWGVAEARKRNLNVIEGTLASAALPEASFDVVTMWDVVEHLTDPLSELRHTHRILRPGGLLVLHTMDIESLFARLMGQHWPWLMEMHLYYFTRRTLQAMLEAAGFEMVRVEPQGRYLRLGYLLTRVRPYSRLAARLLGWFADRLGWREKALSINLGDLVTAYARKV